MLLEKADASQIVLGPPRGLEQLSERPDWQRVAAVVIVDHDPAPVGMAIHSLAAFRAPVHEAIVLQSPDESADRGIPEPFDHTVTATASRSMTSTFPASSGMGSPASVISSTYASAASANISSDSRRAAALLIWLGSLESLDSL